MKDGEVGKDNWAHCRWCNTCNHYHGSLYVCEHYPVDVKQMLHENGDQFRKNLRDPGWRQRQIDNGVPPLAIAVFTAFAGSDDTPETLQ